MWNLRFKITESLPPALGGAFFTTGPLEKSIFICFHSFFFSLFCSSDFHHSVFKVTYLFFCFSYSAIDSSAFFISIIVLFICSFFSSSRSSLNIFFIFSIFVLIVFLRVWIIFTLIILNSFLGRLPIYIPFSYFSGVLSCYFIWDIILCIFILSNFFVLEAAGLYFLLLLSALLWMQLSMRLAEVS